MNILFLDDDINRQHNMYAGLPSANFTLWMVSTAEEAIDSLKRNGDSFFDIVCLDHDLGGMQMLEAGADGTGMDVVKWVIENMKNTAITFIVHSLNPPGASLMHMVLSNAGMRAYKIPFFNLAQTLKGIK